MSFAIFKRAYKFLIGTEECIFIYMRLRESRFMAPSDCQCEFQATFYRQICTLWNGFINLDLHVM